MEVPYLCLGRQVLNFDTELDECGVTRLTKAADHQAETPVGRPTVSQSRTHILTQEADWTWEQMRDFVVTEIETRFGPFPRNPIKEKAIFNAFIGRWNGQSVAIAKAAFDVFDGWWQSAPVSINRFCKNSDPFFAAPIADRLST